MTEWLFDTALYTGLLIALVLLVGRAREERARYAALIAGIATTPRLALAAPMACPMLGEASIVHRLRSLPRTELSARRRWLGRAVLAAGALALPLTGSTTYAAKAQAGGEFRLHPPAPPVPPFPPGPPLPPKAPRGPEPPEAPQPPESVPEMRFVTVTRGDAADPASAGQAGHGGHLVPAEMQAFQRRMGQFARRMEQLRQYPNEEEIERLEREAERLDQQAERLERQVERAIGERRRVTRTVVRNTIDAEAQAKRIAHRISVSCSGPDQPGSGEDEAGERCEAAVVAHSLDGLRAARNAIAGNRAIPEEVRRAVLEELERGIERRAARS